MIVATDFCRCLVLYDVPHDNVFHSLVPMVGECPYLLQIMVANSALYMSNLAETWPPTCNAADTRTIHKSNQWADTGNKHYAVALTAKQRALSMLNSALPAMEEEEFDMVLAMVLLFIEYELLDGGGGEWHHHIRGARSLIAKLSSTNELPASTMTSMRRSLIAKCLM